MARPRTTLKKLPIDWRKTMKAMAADGASATETRAALGIGYSAWTTLLADSGEFRESVKEAEALCQAWWERTGRELAAKGGGNSAIWIFNMKNRFGWRDKDDGASDDGEAPAPVKVEVSVVDARKHADAEPSAG